MQIVVHEEVKATRMKEMDFKMATLHRQLERLPLRNNQRQSVQPLFTNCIGRIAYRHFHMSMRMTDHTCSMLEDQSIQHLISWSSSNESFVMSPSTEFSKVLA